MRVETVSVGTCLFFVYLVRMATVAVYMVLLFVLNKLSGFFSLAGTLNPCVVLRVTGTRRTPKLNARPMQTQGLKCITSSALEDWRIFISHARSVGCNGQSVDRSAA